MAGPLSGSVKVPGVGTVPKGAVAAGILGVLGLIWWSKRKSSTAAPAGTGTDPFPPDGTSGDPTDPNSTDPATGMTYGDENSGSTAAAYGTAAQATALDPYPWDGTTGNANDPYSMDPTSGTTYGNEGGGGSGGGGGSSPSGLPGPPFSSNSQWSQYATDYLVNTIGEAPGTVAADLGAYLAGQAVDATQESVINQAIAYAGQPPVAGASGYPPKIRIKGSKSGGGTKATNPVKNLHVTSTGYTSVDVAWDASKNATGYKVTGAPHVTVSGTTARAGGLTRKHKVTISVLATPAASGIRPASVHATTK